MDNNIAIKAIQDKLEKLSAISTSEQFNSWQKSTTLTLVNVFSESDKRIKSFEEIESYHFYAVSGIDRTQKAIIQAKELLENIIKDIQDFGIPKKLNYSENKSGINISVNQNNTQHQSTNISIQLDFLVEILKDELKGGQIKELKGILESSDEPEGKTKRFIDKIKSFGSDVASNILANLLTNPQVYEQLGRML
jgi:hypothetical protein